MMGLLSDLEKTELSRERVQLDGGLLCDLAEYDIRDYGYAAFAENMEVGSGEFRRARAMMPFKFLDVRARDFDWDIYREDVSKAKRYANGFIVGFDRFVQERKGLYIYSNARTSGKTMLSCCLANEIMERRSICVKFISVPDYLEVVKKKYRDPTEQEELDGIFHAELLIVDDIGAEAKKSWINDEILRLVSSRSSRRCTTIFTSTSSMLDLNLDERIRDQIYQMCIPLKLPDVPVGRNKAEAEKSAFMDQIGNGQAD